MADPCVRHGISLRVRLRAYIPHLLIMTLVLAVYTVLFWGLAGETVRALAQIVRAEDSPHSHIILSENEAGRESFFYIEDEKYEIVSPNGDSVSADVLMTVPGRDYSETSVYFYGTLESGTCAVSANVAAEHGIEKGSQVHIAGNGKTLTVSRIITAQAGLDEDYGHKGIVIISYDGELLDGSHLFMSFDSNSSGYSSIDDCFVMSEIERENRVTLNRLSLAALLAIMIFMLLFEVGVFARFFYGYTDYAVLVSIGEKKKTLFLRVFIDNTLKYIFPAALVCVGYSIVYSCYGSIYNDIVLRFILGNIAVALISSLIAVKLSFSGSFFNMRRGRLCQRKKKRS